MIDTYRADGAIGKRNIKILCMTVEMIHTIRIAIDFRETSSHQEL